MMAEALRLFPGSPVAHSVLLGGSGDLVTSYFRDL